MALHLYIPPHSAHPPGIITGLIMGQILRIYQLNSKQRDKDKDLRNFYTRLLDRGYHSKSIMPLFQRGINNAINYLSQSQAYRDKLKAEKSKKNRRRIFLHLPYHPGDPTSSAVQQVWRKHLYHPQWGLPLNCLTNKRRPLYLLTK